MRRDVSSNRLVRAARLIVGEVVHPRTAFEHLVSVQVLMLSGDSMVAVALAGSLFFSITPTQARPNVLAALLLTFAPLAIVSPALGPILDRGTRIQRTMVIVAAASRAVLCLVMAGNLHSYFLFPEAFAVLVMSKVYMVCKSSLVPSAVGDDEGGEQRYVHANSRLSLYGSVAGFVASVPAIAVLKIPGLGAPWVLRMDAALLCVATYYALRMARSSTSAVGRSAGSDATDPSAPRQGTPGSPASDTQQGGRSAGGSPLGPDLMPTDPYGVPKVTGQTARPAAPATESATAQVRHKALRNKIARQRMAGLFDAASAMAVLRAEVGFLALLLAFALRHEGYATYWFGVVFAGSVAGTLVANAVAPRIREWIAEEKILLASLVAVFGVAGAAAYAGGILAQVALAFTVGLSAGVAKVAFDAMVQRDTPERRRGTTFARFETRFQLVWVIGAVIPVAVEIPPDIGDVAMSCAAGLAAIAYFARHHGARLRRPDS